MSQVLELQWALLHRVPREPRRISTRALYERMQADGRSMTKRTIERNLNAIAAMPMFGLATEVEGGTTYWYFPRAAAGLALPGLTSEAALSLALAERHLGNLLPSSTIADLEPFFAQATRLLDSDAGRRLGSWRQKVRVVTRGPQLAPVDVDPRVKHGITDALVREQQITLTYRGRYAEASSTFDVNPLGLVSKDGILYLVATGNHTPSPRQYALHRCEQVVVRDRRAVKPHRFSLDRYIDQDSAFGYPQGSDNLQLVVDFDPEAARHLSERALAPDQRLEAACGGKTRLSATVADTAELRWWLLGFGELVEIVAPPELREEFRARAKAMSARYRKRKGT